MHLLFVHIRMLYMQQKVLRGRKQKHILKPETLLHGGKERG
jgi:hypothetical protein